MAGRRRSDRALRPVLQRSRHLKTRTLTALYNSRRTPEGRWLDDLHAALDAAVAAAYGWNANISEGRRRWRPCSP